MLIDARSVAPGDEVDTDVCIIGAGPAGIVLAHELSNGPWRVCLLESGAVNPEPATQALYRGNVVGHRYYALDDCRVRRFGGAANRWGGWCRALDPIDFETRQWVPDSGWPVSWAEIDRYTARTRALLQIRSEAEARCVALERGEGRLPADLMTTGLLQFSPLINFGDAFREALFATPNVTVMLHANVSAIEPDQRGGGASIERVRVMTLNGRRFTVRASVFVLATGAIENARMLLLSRGGGAHSNGLGNEHDLVGRYFAEHPHVRYGVLEAAEGVDLGFYDEAQRTGRDPMGWFVLPPAAMAANRVLAFSASLRQRRHLSPSLVLATQSSGFAAAKSLVDAVARGRGPWRMGNRLRAMAAEPLRLARGTVARLPGSAVGPGARLFEIKVRAEQAPNRESRVMLDASATDALGSRVATLDWRLSEIDRVSVRKGVQLLGEAVAAAGIGRVYLPDDGDVVPWDAIGGGWHQMGTTRMASSPRAGVVDPDSRVHGLANLYVAGSSVFPAYGFANPTYSIVLLALRLADHLKARIAAPPPAVTAGQPS
jgi:choline dehydrogenase-like flavoprotein